MALIKDILSHNEDFVTRREFEQYRTTRFPNKRLVILTCMDTRLVELLPRAMGLSPGDVKMIKNAGAIVSHPFGSVMRSILVAIYALDASEVAVIGHHGCGMAGMDAEQILKSAKDRGINESALQEMRESGVNLKQWLCGFDDVASAVRRSVEIIRSHPLLPNDVNVHGLIIHPDTGKLELLVDGYTRADSNL